jgi:hypothetical protein
VLTEKAVRVFLRRDVLMHEIAHHLDRDNFRSKSTRKSEYFADWFATTHGFGDGLTKRID